MRREIYGLELKTTNIKSLGLTSGRAMLRLIHSPIAKKPIEEKPYMRKLQKIKSAYQVESPTNDPVSSPPEKNDKYN